MGKALASAVLAALLVGCNGNPQPILTTADSVTLRSDGWSYGGGHYHAAEAVCAENGKTARGGMAVSSGLNNEYWLVRYNCVEKS